MYRTFDESGSTAWLGYFRAFKLGIAIEIRTKVQKQFVNIFVQELDCLQAFQPYLVTTFGFCGLDGWGENLSWISVQKQKRRFGFYTVLGC